MEQLSVAALSVWIPGRPIPQTRPRVFRSGGVQTDSPACARRKQLVRALCAPLAGPGWPTAGPVRVVLAFSVPGSATGRPDCDNLAKSVLDALGPGAGKAGRWAPILWRDDSQVVELVVSKRQGEQPGVRLEAVDLSL